MVQPNRYAEALAKRQVDEERLTKANPNNSKGGAAEASAFALTRRIDRAVQSVKSRLEDTFGFTEYINDVCHDS